MHTTKWNKPTLKGSILYELNYMTLNDTQEKAKLRKQLKISSYLELVEREG